jgi:CheY-like chemotaxis protein
VNDILDLSKIDAGKMELHSEPYPPAEFIKYLNGVIEPMFKAKGVKLVREGRRFPDRMIIVDKLKYNRIFFNILSNAAKFTPAGGTVMISVKNYRLEGDLLSYDYVISDEGVGMSADFQQKLFKPFEQERPAGSDDNMGSGLGLAITYRFVKLLGGTISVKSAPGKGSAFTIHFALPSAPVKQAAKAAPADNMENLDGKLILVAEDNDINSEILFHLLENHGARATLAKNGAEAVRVFENSAPGSFDAILMDVRMPVMDGKEAARAIRVLDRPDAKTVPIIAATANAYDEDVEACLEAGMNGHIAKPIEPEQLFALLSKVMGNRSQSENSKS